MSHLPALSAGLIDWLMNAALPLWWEKGADHARGGFHEALDAHAEPVTANRRARVQTRQIYVYATAAGMDEAGPWREAVDHGLDFFLSRYRRPDGLYRTMVAPDGLPVDNGAWLYDQAFALLALAHATRVLPEHTELKDIAHALRGALNVWRWPEGGFKEPEADYTHQSNPHMHLLEACLAWAEVDVDPAWNNLADEVAALAMNRFIDANGALHEFFDAGWIPAPGIDGSIIEPGHQLEWAWLLERWARLRGCENAHKVARRLFEIGVNWGVRDNRGVATQQVLEDGSIYNDVARLWPQTERIKAALIMEDSLEVEKAIAGLKLYLDTPITGLWRDKLRPDGSFVNEPAPASSFYHIICAISELQTR